MVSIESAMGNAFMILKRGPKKLIKLTYPRIRIKINQNLNESRSCVQGPDPNRV